MNDELYKIHADNIEDIKNYTDEEMQDRLAKESIEYFSRQRSILRLIQNFMIAGQSINPDNETANPKITSLCFELMEKFIELYPQPQMFVIDANTGAVFQDKFERLLRGKDA